ncbi:hypothetical protein D7X30_11340 [Corallococcus sp. AB011P]|nr:hypothetical protein D7X30_11340 [Corallococcus sp. AB011P]RKH76960.1 hypothetical protein D7Y21_37970 [Corallococcus sp. AB045]
MVQALPSSHDWPAQFASWQPTRWLQFKSASEPQGSVAPGWALEFESSQSGRSDPGASAK